MQLTAAYRAAPGCCAVCRTPNPDQPIVDLEIMDPGVIFRASRVYLCGTCVMQAASLVAEQMGRAIVDSDFKTRYAGVVDDLGIQELRVSELEADLASMNALIAKAVS
jgi:hypothetical protein